MRGDRVAARRGVTDPESSSVRTACPTSGMTVSTVAGD
jgi:hypothetical protein